jgi:hypothetical protein
VKTEETKKADARAGATRREAEKKSAATTVTATKARNRKTKGAPTKEREIAEALFDLATLAADVDRETEAPSSEKNGKRKRSRTTKKIASAMFTEAATTMNDGHTNVSAGTQYGMHASAGFGAGLGLGQFPSVFPPPPIGYYGGPQAANPYGISLPRPKNATLHVYIAHFIDYTQQVLRQTAPALDAGAANVAGETLRAGDPSTSMASAGFPGTINGLFPSMMNPHVMAALLSAQPMMAGGGAGGAGGAPDPQLAQQQLQVMNMMMQQAAAFPMLGAEFPTPAGASSAGKTMGVPTFPPMGNNPMTMAMMGASMPPHVLEAMNAMAQLQPQPQPQQTPQTDAPVNDEPVATVAAGVKVEPPVAAAQS